jgi:hypothetical protein
MDLRDLLDYSPDALVRGCMLLTPDQRARLRAALHQADSSVSTDEEAGMSLMDDLTSAIEKVAKTVEDHVENFDTAAVAEVRILAAQAKEAETTVMTLASNYKAEIVALAKQYEPEVVDALEGDADKLITSLKALFGIG